MSALLLSLGVFRFQFLQHAPSAGSRLSLPGLDAQEKRSLALLWVIFAITTAGIAAASYLSYQHSADELRAQAESQLLSIAGLKVDELLDWRQTLLAQAELLRQNPAFGELVQHYFENPQDLKAQASLRSWLALYLADENYDAIFLLDANREVKIAAPENARPAPTHLVQDVQAALVSGQVILQDFHRDTEDGAVHLDLLAPVAAPEAPRRILGVVMLRIDPQTYLYPYLARWPVPSASAETLLVRREGKEVVFLNPLRFRPDAALNLRIPLQEGRVLAAKAALGQTGVAKGIDYRGQEVVGALLRVPDTPWFLVARIDADELFASTRQRLWQTLTFFSLLIALAGAGLGLVWRQQRVHDYQARYQTIQALRRQNEYLNALQETTVDLLSQMELDTLLENLVKRAGQLLDTSAGYLDLVEPQSDRLEPRVGLGALAESLKHPVALGEGLSGIVWQTRQPLVVEDYDLWPGRIADYPVGLLSSVVAVPLLCDGEVLGVLGVGRESTDRRPFQAEEIKILTDFARLATIAIENARLYATAQNELAERKQKEAQLLATQSELQRLLELADQSRRALLSVVEDQKIAAEQIRQLNAELERRVEARTAQLAASNKELEAFAYSVSHDLRAPLRAIDGFSRILEKEYAHSLDAEGLRLLGVIRQSTANMDRLITDLLALSRVSRSALRISRIDMTAMAQAVYQEIASPEVLEKFTFIVNDLPPAPGDPTLIRQVWVNLISNAIKYTLPRPECVIEISGWAKDGLCTYLVQDSGVGYNPQYQDKLFGLFQRLHKAGEFEGTGVGLAIVQRIIHRHGGQVWSESEVGKGAKFYFTLPEKEA